MQVAGCRLQVQGTGSSVRLELVFTVYRVLAFAPPKCWVSNLKCARLAVAGCSGSCDLANMHLFRPDPDLTPGLPGNAPLTPAPFQ